jgi:hypothetical protein
MAFARLNSFWTNFYRIAKEEKILFDQAYTYNPEPKIEEEPELYHEIREKMFNHGIKTIVFSAFTLESFINDLASVKLGDSQKNGVKSRSLTFVNIFFGQKGINQLFDYLFVFFLNFLELRQQLSVFKFCLCNICRRPFAEIVTGNAESIAHSLLGVGRGSGYSPFIVAGHHFGHISATYTWKTWFVPYFPIYDDCLMG